MWMNISQFLLLLSWSSTLCLIFLLILRTTLERKRRGRCSGKRDRDRDTGHKNSWRPLLSSWKDGSVCENREKPHPLHPDHSVVFWKIPHTCPGPATSTTSHSIPSQPQPLYSSSPTPSPWPLSPRHRVGYDHKVSLKWELALKMRKGNENNLKYSRNYFSLCHKQGG